MSEVEPRAQAFDLRAVDEIVAETVEPAAVAVDEAGAFPRAALAAFGRAGLLGLVSSREVGGLGPPRPSKTDDAGPKRRRALQDRLRGQRSSAVPAS